MRAVLLVLAAIVAVAVSITHASAYEGELNTTIRLEYSGGSQINFTLPMSLGSITLEVDADLVCTSGVPVEASGVLRVTAGDTVVEENITFNLGHSYNNIVTLNVTSRNNVPVSVEVTVNAEDCSPTITDLDAKFAGTIAWRLLDYNESSAVYYFELPEATPMPQRVWFAVNLPPYTNLTGARGFAGGLYIEGFNATVILDLATVVPLPFIMFDSILRNTTVYLTSDNVNLTILVNGTIIDYTVNGIMGEDSGKLILRPEDNIAGYVLVEEEIVKPLRVNVSYIFLPTVSANATASATVSLNGTYYTVRLTLVNDTLTLELGNKSISKNVVYAAFPSLIIIDGNEFYVWHCIPTSLLVTCNFDAERRTFTAELNAFEDLLPVSSVSTEHLSVIYEEFKPPLNVSKLRVAVGALWAIVLTDKDRKVRASLCMDDGNGLVEIGGYRGRGSLLLIDEYEFYPSLFRAKGEPVLVIEAAAHVTLLADQPAFVTIYDEAGRVVWQGEVPATVELFPGRYVINGVLFTVEDDMTLDLSQFVPKVEEVIISVPERIEAYRGFNATVTVILENTTEFNITLVGTFSVDEYSRRIEVYVPAGSNAANASVSVPPLSPGEHTLRAEFGGVSNETTITVAEPGQRLDVATIASVVLVAALVGGVVWVAFRRPREIPL